MSLLHGVEESVATGAVKEVYDEMKAMIGMVPEGLKLWSLNPDALKQHWSEIKQSFQQVPEIQMFDTILRYLVSESEGCAYCVGVNAGLLINMFGMTQEELSDMSKNPQSAPLSEEKKALLLFALKVIKDSKKVNEEDIETLKASGISENEIFDVALKAVNLLASDILLNTFKVEA